MSVPIGALTSTQIFLQAQQEIVDHRIDSLRYALAALLPQGEEDTPLQAFNRQSWQDAEVDYGLFREASRDLAEACARRRSASFARLVQWRPLNGMLDCPHEWWPLPPQEECLKVGPDDGAVVVSEGLIVLDGWASCAGPRWLCALCGARAPRSPLEPIGGGPYEVRCRHDETRIA